MNDTLVVTHSADLDGQCSQAIARRALGDKADYLPWDYGMPVPDLAPYSTVYLIDTSLPPEVMRANAGKLVWLDHHKTAMAAMAGVPIRGCRIDGIAACRIAWQWFAWIAHEGHPDQGELPTKDAYLARTVTEPYAVQLLGEYDVFRRDNLDTDLFQLGMQAEKEPRWDVLFKTTNPDHWTRPCDAPYRDEIDRIVERGTAIQSYLDVTNAQIATERGFDVRWEGLLFRALNIARCSSLTFTAALRPEHDGCLGYFWDGGKWRFSLYGVPHEPDADLSVIAKKHGGGGHRSACGFALDVLPQEFGGPVNHLLQIKLQDNAETRALFQRFNTGETQLRETFHEFMRPVIDEAFDVTCADPRVAAETSSPSS